jgi:zinc protease
MKKFVNTRTKMVAILLVLALSFASTVWAQQGPTAQTGPAGQSIKGAELKGKVPVNKEILKVKLPKEEEASLSNGLRVVLLESHKVPTFAMQMVFLSGGLADPSDHHGLASFTAALLREGTTKRSSREIAEQIDSIGGTLGANSGLSSITSNVSTTGLVENYDQVLEIFSDIIRNPSFPQEEVDKYKARLISQLQFQRSLPQFLAQERFNQAIYGNHPASLVSPPIDSLKRTTSADLATFHSTYYRPNNAILFIVGDVTLKEILPKLERAFDDWQKGTVPATKVPSVQEPSKSGIYLIDRPNSVQTILQLGSLGIERTSPDYFPLLVMNQIFGAGPASRLFMNLREDKGYTYGAYSSINSSKYRGTIAANSEVRTEVTEGAMKEFMLEIKRIREEKVSAVELENARRAIIGSFALSLEQPLALLSNILTQKLYNLPSNYWEMYPQLVSSVTVDDVQRVAQKYLDPSTLHVVAVGDAAKTGEVLAKFGRVETFDADGKPVQTAK